MSFHIQGIHRVGDLNVGGADRKRRFERIWSAILVFLSRFDGVHGDLGISFEPNLASCSLPPISLHLTDDFWRVTPRRLIGVKAA
jgi:hypothetical protein